MTLPVERRRRGRPRLSLQPWDTLNVRLPQDLHDEACREALRSGDTVSEVLRRALRAHLRERLSNYVVTK